jgi:glycyl-tRNA synthetase beta chain
MEKDFLLEINTEELPASYIKDALENLCGGFHVGLRNLGLQFDPTPIENLGTKDSLVCYIKKIDLCQKEGLKQVLGPPKRIAFDEKGNPTKEAIGFAKNQGVRVEDLKTKKTPKGEYVIIEKKEESRDTKDILKEITPHIVKNVHFPKTMRWDDSGLRFARPIESVLALFGEENLDIKLGDVPQKKIDPIAPAEYLEYLKEHGKLINFDVRKKEIKSLILNAVKRLGADEVVDEDLLDEVNFMVNSPDVLIGEFDKRFLALPEDVLKASMSKHQRVFPVSKDGRLINRFIAIVDGKINKKLVRKNYERILEAKLQDSLFFFDEDTKKALPENISQLKALIFQKDLGNMFEKIERLKKVSLFICEKLGADSSLKIDTEKAAGLSKLDLVTHMVGEFPSLQGVMGREYALKNGEKKEVAAAIGEHYLPQGSDDDLPKTQAGAILAISDKIDNVVGFSGIGADAEKIKRDIEKMKITGSLDPFGIRRSALGIVRIIKDRSLRLNLDEVIEKSIELYGAKIKWRDAVRFKKEIVKYIKDRIDFLMGDVRPLELKRAVLESGPFDIADIFKRQEVLAGIKKERYFLEAAKVVERTSNILKGAKKEEIGEVKEDLFKEDQERKVWKAYLDKSPIIQKLIDNEEYEEATKEYAHAFFKELHDFFDKVLVNVEDSVLRSNRLAIMKAINRLYTERIADLSLLPQIVVQ